MLTSLEADCLLVSPIVVDERTVGLLCVTEPRQNTEDLLLLSVAAAVCYREASSRRREDAKLEIAYYEMNFLKLEDACGEVTFILGLRDVDEEARRQLKQTREMEMQREIIEGLGTEYYSVLLVNPETDTVAFYRSATEHTAATDEILGRNGNSWSSLMQCYAREQVSESSRAEYLEKMSLEYIRAQKRDYTVNAEVLINGAPHYIQLRVAYVHEADGSRAAVIGTRNVDDLILKERQQAPASGSEAARNGADRLPLMQATVCQMKPGHRKERNYESLCTTDFTANAQMRGPVSLLHDACILLPGCGGDGAADGTGGLL